MTKKWKKLNTAKYVGLLSLALCVGLFSPFTRHALAASGDYGFFVDIEKNNNYYAPFNLNDQNTYYGQSFNAQSDRMDGFVFYYDGSGGGYTGGTTSIEYSLCVDPSTSWQGNPCNGKEIVATGTVEIDQTTGWKYFDFGSTKALTIGAQYGAVIRNNTVAHSSWGGDIGFSATDDYYASGVMLGSATDTYRDAVFKAYYYQGDSRPQLDQTIPGYLYFQAPYYCEQNNQCSLYYYYNQSVFPDQTNRVYVYESTSTDWTKATFNYSATVDNPSIPDTTDGTSRVQVYYDTPGLNYVWITASTSSWVYSSGPLKVYVGTSTDSVYTDTNDSDTTLPGRMLSSLKGKLLNIFPFVFYNQVQEAWNSATTTPAEYSFLNPADSNGDVSLTIGSQLLGATSTFKIINTSAADPRVINIVKIISRLIVIASILILLIVCARKLYKEQAGVASLEQDDK